MFSPEGVHLHLSLSDGDCQVWGGHLEEGTIVLKGADILVGLLEQENLYYQKTNTTNNDKLARVEIAVIKGCPWSNRAIRILKSLDIKHIVQTIENDEAFEALKKRSGISTFPQIFIDGEPIGGYEALAELHGTGKLEALR